MKVRKVMLLEITMDEEELSVILDGLRVLEMDGSPESRKIAAYMREKISEEYTG